MAMKSEVTPDMWMMKIDIDIVMDKDIAPRREFTMGVEVIRAVKLGNRRVKNMGIQMMDAAMAETLDGGAPGVVPPIVVAVSRHHRPREEQCRAGGEVHGHFTL
jgi:hypothetical protein